MQPESLAFLWDALQASRRAESVGRDRGIGAYLEDWLLQAAAERQLEILGEALKQLRAVDGATSERIPNVHAIIATRNVLVHAYARVDQERVWDILTRDLPVLVPILEGLLADAEGE